MLKKFTSVIEGKVQTKAEMKAVNSSLNLDLDLSLSRVTILRKHR
jgi:hypothetical protein